MDIKRVSEGFSVSGQLTPADLERLRDAGVRTLIGNRPDGEAADQPAYAEIEARARELGIAIHYLPVVHDYINSHDVRAFRHLLDDAAGPVHAWCRSGLRSVTLWSLAQIQDGTDPDTLVQQAAALGFDFSSFQHRFRPVIDDLGGMFQKLPVSQHCQLLIVGGGSAGISLAASLLRRDAGLQITLVEPSEQHHYQPGFTLVGGGAFPASKTHRNTIDLLPRNVQWLKASASHFMPDQNQVVLDGTTRVSYDRLVVCPGLKLNWAAISGLQETLGRNGVTSNYLPGLASYTWQLVRKLRKGKALFTQPPMPIKCAGAPQKALYLSASHWLRQDCLQNIDIHFYNAGAVLFGVSEYVPALQSYIDRYRAQVHYAHNLIRVDGARRLATFATTDTDGNTVQVETAFDMLHVCPPQCAPDFIRNSPLADRAGWVDVDPASLRHRRYANIWGLGDVTNTPNAKTMAAVRKQVPVVADNIVADLRAAPANAIYEGYGACPLTVEHGRVVFAEFGYGGALQPTFPRWLLEGTHATRLGWLLKKRLLPHVYWQLMLKGHETLAAPARKP